MRCGPVLLCSGAGFLLSSGALSKVAMLRSGTVMLCARSGSGLLRSGPHVLRSGSGVRRSGGSRAEWHGRSGPGHRCPGASSGRRCSGPARLSNG
jgi:hypothetical protein